MTKPGWDRLGTRAMGTGTRIIGFGRRGRLLGGDRGGGFAGCGCSRWRRARRRRATTSSRSRRTRTTSIKIAKGKPKTIKTSVPFYEIVIGDPEIANVNPLTDSSFYVLGNNLGTTGIALFDENKQLVGTVDIEVTLDTDRLASTIRDSVPAARTSR